MRFCGFPLSHTPPIPKTHVRGSLRRWDGCRKCAKIDRMKRVVLKTLKRHVRRAKSRRKVRVMSEYFVVRVKAGRERYAARNVRQQGYETFIPFIVEEDKTREQPLFPGHIFVKGPQWFYLRNTYGVLHPIMMGDRPAYMPLREMRELMRACDREGVITVQREKFTEGQKVEIKQGSWQGHIGVYTRASSKDRVRVLLKLLGGEHELEFHHSHITAATQSGNGSETEPKAGSRVVTTKRRGRRNG